MRSTPWFFALPVLLVLALPGCGSDGAEPTPEAEDPLAAEVRRRFDAAARQGFSGTAWVVVGGEVTFAQGYGLADRRTGTRNEPDTAFDFGSIMKDFTAAAIFQLDAEGKLSVDDTVSDFFPTAPPDKGGITVLQLLQHRSGLGEYHDTQGDFEPLTRAQARAAIFAQELSFRPGSNEAYSNSGYTLLADIIERSSGDRFVEYVHAALLEPAGMMSTGFYGEARWQKVDTAIGTGARRFQDNDPASWPLTWALVGNGGLVSTAPDLALWFSALHDGRVLHARALAAYREQYLQPSAVAFQGHSLFAFAGAGDYGLGGIAVDSPEQDRRFVIGTNAYDAFHVEAFASKLAELVFDERAGVGRD
jgi:CubicO group peptidase (beta-lactamase class C family)